MVKRDPSRNRSRRSSSAGELSRREFMKRAAALGLATAGAGAGLGSQVGTAAATAAAYTPELIAARAAAQVAEVPREETLVAVRSRSQGKFIEDQALESLPPHAPTTSSART